MKTKKLKIVLGKDYRDTVTGTAGTATARTEYLTGVPRVMLENTCWGAQTERWFDEVRLEKRD